MKFHTSSYFDDNIFPKIKGIKNNTPKKIVEKKEDLKSPYSIRKELPFKTILNQTD